MRVVKLFQSPIVQDGDFVKIDNRLQFMGYGYDGVFCELPADDLLD